MIMQIINLSLAVSLLFLLYALPIKTLGMRTLCGLLFGVGLGSLMGFIQVQGTNGFEPLLYFIGHAYLGLLKMLVTPLIITSIINAIINLGDDNKQIERLTIGACSMLLLMTALASAIGLGVGIWFNVGAHLNLPTEMLKPSAHFSGIANTLLGMVPSNPVGIMVQDNTIALVVLSVLIGLAAKLMQVTHQQHFFYFRQAIEVLFELTKKLAYLILRLTPYAVFSLLTVTLMHEGNAVLLEMLHFIVAMYVAMLFVIAMHSLILFSYGYSPVRYLQNAAMPLFVAFTTRSSLATLPVTEETLQKKFNCHQITATFVPSVGATFGMNACAGVFPAMLVVMAMTILHQPITYHTVLMVMFINMIASLGISGIPGSAYIAATVTLTSLNLPYAVVGLVQGIDPIVDMGRTATNVNGVLTTALVVDRYLEQPAGGITAIKDPLQDN